MAPAPTRPLGTAVFPASPEVGWDTPVRGLEERCGRQSTRQWGAEKDASGENAVFHQLESECGVFVTFSFMGRKYKIFFFLNFVSEILSQFPG